MYNLDLFFLSVTATTEIYTLSLHDALPISPGSARRRRRAVRSCAGGAARGGSRNRSEEHTSELQSQFHLVCRLLHEKKNHLTQPANGLYDCFNLDGEQLRRLVPASRLHAAD